MSQHSSESLLLDVDEADRRQFAATDQERNAEARARSVERPLLRETETRSSEMVRLPEFWV
jgi:hypothetical protein